jgi:hypothetical protein
MNRISHRNKITLDIKNAKSAIDKNTQTITRLRKLPSSDFNTSQINKLKDQNNAKKESIALLEKELVDLNSGKLDEHISKELEENVKRVNAISTKKKTNDSLIANETSKNVREMEKHRTDFSSDVKHNKYVESSMQKSYDYFMKISNSIPEYLSRQLEKLPNNHGVIWRDVFFYGKLPDNGGSHIMHENTSKSVTKIHEWNRKTRTYTLKIKTFNEKNRRSNIKLVQTSDI